MEKSELVVHSISGRDIKQWCSNWLKKKKKRERERERWESTGAQIKEKGTVFRDDWENKE